VVARLAGGSEVTVAEARQQEGRAWYRIEADGLKAPGWVRGDMLRRLDAPAATPAPVAAAPEPVAIPELKSPDDWSRRIADLMPAIRACLEATAVKPATVTKAWPMNHGMAGVRLRDAAGDHAECITPANGGTPERYAALEGGARPLPGEGRPVFTPAPQPAPTGPCWRNEPVVLPGDAEPAGTLSYSGC
jgi:hypothetical protein